VTCSLQFFVMARHGMTQTDWVVRINESWKSRADPTPPIHFEKQVEGWTRSDETRLPKEDADWCGPRCQALDRSAR
jgi:hypothetical protein